MAVDKVKDYFKAHGIDHRVLEFDVSSATVELAAKALNCEGSRIIEVVLVVTAGDAKIDNTKYKTKFGIKAKMLKFDDLESLVGHSAGGVCPFAVNEGVKVYLDESLKRFQTIFPACGSANSAIELTIPELEKYSNQLEWVDVCKIPESV